MVVLSSLVQFVSVAAKRWRRSRGRCSWKHSTSTEYLAPTLRLRVTCGKGFYVRSLAHDLGAALGVGGSLSGLVRTRVGPFRVEDAVDLETLRGELESGMWRHRLWASDEVLLGWRATHPR